MQDSDRPYKFATIWGASATSGYLTAVIPPTATGASASQVLGFPPITSVDPGAGGIPPDIADFNGVLQYLSAWDRWAQAGGPIYFDGSFSTAIGGYPKGAVLAQAATLGQFWISTVENNTSNPDVGGANWDTLLPFAAVNGDATKVFNVANATTATEAVALGQFLANASTTGSLTLPNGWMFKWVKGAPDPADNSEPTQTLAWDAPFSNAVFFGGVSTEIASATILCDMWYQFYSLSTAGVSVQRQHSGGSVSNTVTTTPWAWAIGN